MRPRLEGADDGRQEMTKADRKKLRKNIRKNLFWYSFREVMRDSWQHLFDQYLCVFFWKRRLRRSLEFTRNALGAAMLNEGVVLDFTPSILPKDEEVVLKLKDEIARGIWAPDKNIVWGFIEGFGSHLGEVIIRNKGGTWVFPRRTKLWSARLHKDMSLFYDLWYVESSGRRVYAIKIARLFWERGYDATSLVDAYKQVPEARPDPRNRSVEVSSTGGVS